MKVTAVKEEKVDYAAGTKYLLDLISKYHGNWTGYW